MVSVDKKSIGNGVSRMNESIVDLVRAAPSPNGTQFFHFRINFRRKAPTSEVGIPKREILDPPLMTVCLLCILGNDLMPLNISLRKKQKSCASFLLTKQWSKIIYTTRHSIPLSIYVKMRRWADRSKDKVTTPGILFLSLNMSR